VGRRRVQRAGPVGIAVMIAGLALPAPSGADALPEARGSEPFEVIVVRGAGVSRVTGTQSGVISREVLREDPHPARRASKPKSSARAQNTDLQLTVIFYAGPEFTAGYPLIVGDRHFDRAVFRGHGGKGFRGHGRNRQHHRVWRGDHSSQRSYRVSSHGRGGHGGGSASWPR